MTTQKSHVDKKPVETIVENQVVTEPTISIPTEALSKLGFNDNNNNNIPNNQFNNDNKQIHINSQRDEVENVQQEVNRYERRQQYNNYDRSNRQDRSYAGPPRFQHDHSKPKIDFKAIKAEEEAQLAERFKGSLYIGLMIFN